METDKLFVAADAALRSGVDRIAPIDFDKSVPYVAALPRTLSSIFSTEITQPKRGWYTYRFTAGSKLGSLPST